MRVGECLVVPNLERPKAVRAVACDSPHQISCWALWPEYGKAKGSVKGANR